MTSDRINETVATVVAVPWIVLKRVSNVSSHHINVMFGVLKFVLVVRLIVVVAVANCVKVATVIVIVATVMAIVATVTAIAIVVVVNSEHIKLTLLTLNYKDNGNLFFVQIEFILLLHNIVD